MHLIRFEIDYYNNFKIYINNEKYDVYNNLFKKLEKHFPITHELFFVYRNDEEIGISINSIRSDFDLYNKSNDMNEVLIPYLRMLLRNEYILEPIRKLIN